ncbi:MAG: hypothetical protein ACRDNY_07960 [Gaiellaceae bacterium]
MRTLLRLVVLVGLAIWGWRHFVGSREPQERASVSFADGSAIVLEPGSAAFERLAALARSALRP